MTDTAVQTPTIVDWKLHWEGETYTEDDINGAAMMQLAAILGDTWQALSPLNGPLSLISFIIILAHIRTGEDMTALSERVQAASVNELLDALETIEITNNN